MGTKPRTVIAILKAQPSKEERIRSAPRERVSVQALPGKADERLATTPGIQLLARIG
jgi:hypothetical protein